MEAITASTGAHMALGRTAKRYSVTQREVLERQLSAEDDKILKSMEFGTDEWNVYLDG